MQRPPISLISVIITVVDKDKPYLKECLISLEKSAKFAGIPLEFIIIANGTDISTIDYLKSPLRLINNKNNIGFGQAINIGVSRAKGSWCLLTCPDVRTGFKCLKTIFTGHTHKNFGLIGPKVSLADGHLQFTILPYPDLWQIFLEQTYLYKFFPKLFNSPLANQDLYQENQTVEAVAAIWWLFRKDSFEEIGGFDSRFFLYLEDIDLCKRLREKGYKIGYYHQAEAVHLLHKSTGGYGSGKLYYQSLKKLIEKYHGFIYTRLSLSIFLFGCVFRILYWKIKFKLIRRSFQNSDNYLFCRDVLKSLFI